MLRLCTTVSEVVREWCVLACAGFRFTCPRRFSVYYFLFCFVFFISISLISIVYAYRLTESTTPYLHLFHTIHYILYCTSRYHTFLHFLVNEFLYMAPLYTHTPIKVTVQYAHIATGLCICAYFLRIHTYAYIYALHF